MTPPTPSDERHIADLQGAVERFRWSLEDQDLDDVKRCLIDAEEALLRAREEFCNEHA